MPRIKPLTLLPFAAALFAGHAYAQGLIPAHRIPAELANQAVAAAVASCATQGYADSAVVVDADGVRQALLRGDRAGSHTLDSAFDKAYTSASFKADTSALFERSQSAPGFSNLFTQVPHLMLFGGGVVIKVGDEVVGAIGAAGAPGGNLDEACARAALDKIRDQLKQLRLFCRRRRPRQRIIPETRRGRSAGQWCGRRWSSQLSDCATDLLGKTRPPGRASDTPSPAASGLLPQLHSTAGQSRRRDQHYR